MPEFAATSTQRELNQAQQAALDLSSNIALTAAAGSGKTTVLIERFLEILRNNGYKTRRGGCDHLHRRSGPADV